MKLCERNNCLSCCACYSSCPKNAISMIEDELGKIIPVIDQSICIDCGLCEKACPQIHRVERTKPLTCYAGYLKDNKDANKSASGGFATAIARQVLRKNGVICGPIFQNGQLVFSSGSDEAFLDMLRGSKYVYSFPGKIYSEIKKHLSDGKYCIFFGLPCQVAGLNAYLGEKNNRLVTVDLICHGAPPFKYLKDHIEQLGFLNDYKSVSFRGEKHFFLTLKDYSGNQLYSRRQQEDEYFEGFMSGLLHRECCYSCEFACDSRVSDITLGDFWGLSKDALDGYKGRVSCALLNTEKGIEVFKEATRELIVERRQIAEAVAGNDQLRSPSRCHPSRKVFEDAYISNGFSFAMKASGITRRVKLLRVKNKLLWAPRKIKRLFRKVFGK